MINTYDPKHYTLICELFNACNMNCEFCVKHVEKPDLVMDVDYIVNQLPNDLEVRLLDEFKTRKVDTLLFNLYGGELFMPYCIINGFLDYYERLVRDVRARFSFIKNIYVNFVSNGTFYGYEDQVKFFLDKLAPCKLNISFDPSGRYQSEEQRLKVLETIEKMKDYIEIITTTITKPNIEAIIANDAFAQFKDYDLDLSYFLPMNVDNKKLMPSDEDMYRFYKYIVDKKYWNVGEIKNIIIGLKDPSIEVHSYCHRAMITSKVHDETVFNSCCFDMVKNFYKDGINNYFNHTYLADITNPAIEDKRLIGRNARGCNYCEYQNICPSICHIAILWKDMKLTHCPLHHIISDLKANPQLVNEAWELIKGDL